MHAATVVAIVVLTVCLSGHQPRGYHTDNSNKEMTRTSHGHEEHCVHVCSGSRLNSVHGRAHMPD
eukprot:1161669-Pelagomonas_calceolata.AAC.6